jgi:hypothetical protein
MSRGRPQSLFAEPARKGKTHLPPGNFADTTEVEPGRSRPAYAAFTHPTDAYAEG